MDPDGCLKKQILNKITHVVINKITHVVINKITHVVINIPVLLQ